MPVSRHGMRARLISVRSILLLSAALCGLLPWLGRSPRVAAEVGPGGPSNPAAGHAAARPSPDGYAGAAACAGCHRDIYRSYTRTGMGRSMSLATPEVVQAL